MSQAGPQDREPTVRLAESAKAPVAASASFLSEQVQQAELAVSADAKLPGNLEDTANQHGIVSKHTKQVDREVQAYPHLQQDQRLDNRIWITTPEQIRFRYSTVGAQRRFIAFGLDLIYMFGGLGVFIFLIWILLALMQYLLGTSLVLQDFLEGVTAFATLVIIFVIYWFGTAIQEFFWSGKTLGKLTLGIRVVSMDGRPPSLLQSFGRNFLRLADGLPAFPLIFLIPVGTPEAFVSESLMLPTFLVGLTSMLLTRRFQRVGDLFAGTMVIDHEKYQDATVPIFHDRELLSLALSIPRDFHPNRELLETLSLYVSRRVGFHHQRRVQMTSHLAAPLLRQWDLPPQTNYDLFIGALYVRSVCEYGQIESMLEDLPQGNGPMNLAQQKMFSGDQPSVAQLTRFESGMGQSASALAGSQGLGSMGGQSKSFSSIAEASTNSETQTDRSQTDRSSDGGTL